MSHTCSAIVVHCIDFRLEPSIHEFLKEHELLGDCDIVGIAGAAKCFDGGSDQETLMKQIKISSDLHKISKVILMNHTDCGAYGGRDAFTDRDEEDAAHKKALGHAKGVLASEFPHLEVKEYIAQIESDGGIHIEHV